MRKQIQKRLPKFDYVLIALVLAVIIFGLSMLASALVANNTNVFRTDFLKQLALGFGLGGLSCLIFSRVSYEELFKQRFLIIVVTLFSLLVVFIPTAGAEVYARLNGLNPALVKQSWADSLFFLHYANSAIRWIDLGVAKVQPAEFAKIGLLVYFTSFLPRAKNAMNFTWQNYKNPIWAFVLSALMIVFQPDLGSVVVLSVIILSVMWVSKFPIHIFASILTFVVIFGAFFSFFASYRSDRITAWAYLNFCSEYSLTDLPPKEDMTKFCQIWDFTTINRDNLWQTSTVRNAISNGGLFGVGYLNGELKSNVPEVSTDAIIAVIGEEVGWLSIVVLLAVYLFIFQRGLRIANLSDDTAASALAIGISIWILFQAFWNVAGMTGMLPMKGLPLPLISEGGSSVLVLMTAIGILINISHKVHAQINAEIID